MDDIEDDDLVVKEGQEADEESDDLMDSAGEGSPAVKLANMIIVGPFSRVHRIFTSSRLKNVFAYACGWMVFYMNVDPPKKRAWFVFAFENHD